MGSCPDDQMIRPGDYDPEDIEWWTRKGIDVNHMREIHELAESRGWYVWLVSLPDESSGGDFFCDTYYCLRNDAGDDISDVIDAYAGLEDESLIGILEFWEPYLRAWKGNE